MDKLIIASDNMTIKGKKVLVGASTQGCNKESILQIDQGQYLIEIITQTTMMTFLSPLMVTASMTQNVIRHGAIPCLS